MQVVAADPAGLEAALAALAEGRLVGLPTETVYGLAADATDGRTVAGIYAAKGRPSFNPLIAHVADLAEAERHGRFGADARRLAEAFWPGPLTLVVPKRPDSTIADLCTAGLETVALRVPATAVARDLIRRFGRPLAAPSANRSGRISPTAAEDVVAELGDRVAVVIDGGRTPVGVESTIVACLDGHVRLLRPGGVPRAAIEAAIGRALDPDDAEGSDPARPLAPGLLVSHYAPNASVRLDAAEVRPGEALLAFGPDALPGQERAVARINLSPTGDLAEAAAGLFRALRQLDASGAPTIAVAPIPADGLGEAIRDRLGRAAAPRG
ncbi:L-threonylcarbamoyladenylate synthase [Prosthecomicrobium hirschii]|uniref:L-threonylcarbamoyladenylate synthase n=1 Tax=Prosthecodimorpha hirschii TaxID=665126 RepID=UPI00221F34B5|nr:L-threonylcarbamoyladenylate synthase [Prosthecomicrobium hirschii]MCW1843840.1 L-threonylcarbamoyladenylate synthase [Prosthecomicrobium hirschii]